MKTHTINRRHKTSTKSRPTRASAAVPDLLHSAGVKIYWPETWTSGRDATLPCNYKSIRAPDLVATCLLDMKCFTKWIDIIQGKYREGKTMESGYTTSCAVVVLGQPAAAFMTVRTLFSHSNNTWNIYILFKYLEFAH